MPSSPRPGLLTERWPLRLRQPLKCARPPHPARHMPPVSSFFPQLFTHSSPSLFWHFLQSHTSCSGLRVPNGQGLGLFDRDRDRAEETRGPGYKGKLGGGPHSASLISASNVNASWNPTPSVPCLPCSPSHPKFYSPLYSQD